MRRWPLIPSLVVATAVLTMIGLGIWQLRRAEWKEDLIARFTANRDRPAVGWPSVPTSDDGLLYRRATGFCLEPVGWRAVAGRNLANETGWSHIASCRTGGGEGPGMQVDIGWSKSAKPPAWRGGEVTGIIVPDSKHEIRLVSASAPAGLEPSRPPDPSETANNHLFYALQWFFFAGAAAVIYLLALRRRWDGEGAEARP